MRLKLNQKQILAARNLIANLDRFVREGYGTIRGLMMLKNNMLPDTIIIKYEKIFAMGGNLEYEYPLATIGGEGEIKFIGDNFKDFFERAAFLAECQPLDLDNPNDYYLID